MQSSHRSKRRAAAERAAQERSRREREQAATRAGYIAPSYVRSVADRDRIRRWRVVSICAAGVLDRPAQRPTISYGSVGASSPSVAGISLEHQFNAALWSGAHERRH
jgi:hypothetical protein